MWCWKSAGLARGNALVCGIVLVLAVSGTSSARVSSSLPDGRGYELVTPPANKNGGDVMATSDRTRVAMDGSAVSFASLTAYGDVVGTGIATDYMAVRSSDVDPRMNGWTTHALTPPRNPTGVNASILFDPLYVGDLAPDLTRGVVRTPDPLTDAASVAKVPNLYLRSNLRTAEHGAYELVTACPLCDLSGTPLLPPPTDTLLAPGYAGASDNFRHIAFQQSVDLTSDAPPQPGGCPADEFSCLSRAYEWVDGEVRLVGLVPQSGDTSCGGTNPPCVAADATILGRGVETGSSLVRPLNVISSDGTRIFFGNATNGRLYVRIGGTTTDELSASERTDCAGDPTCGGDGVPDPAPAPFKPSTFWGASADGSRAFFSTAAAFTDDAPVNNSKKLYMYDASKAASDSHNLTYLNVDRGNEGVANNMQGVIAESEDGRYVYFITTGQIVAGEPSLEGGRGFFVWHDGSVAFIGKMISDEISELLTTGNNYAVPTQGRVTPDGRHLLLSVHDASGLPVTDPQPGCQAKPGGCRRELYVYSADTGVLACASCNTSGEPPTGDAAAGVRVNASSAAITWHLNHAITDDGSRVFFTSGDQLVPQDTNGKLDVYQYDTPTRQVRLITSGSDPFDSFFLDATPNGSNVFFVTRERLVGWDTDSSYDLYDARVGGGFPEPPPPAARCSGSVCQDGHGPPSSMPPVGTSEFEGGGDLVPALKPHTATRHCKKGYVTKPIRGKRRCVKRKRRHAKHEAKLARTQQQRRTK